MPADRLSCLICLDAEAIGDLEPAGLYVCEDCVDRVIDDALLDAIVAGERSAEDRIVTPADLARFRAAVSVRLGEGA